MRIEFSIEELGTTDKDLFIEFSKDILFSIRKGIRATGLTDKVQTKEYNLINSGLVKWVLKPKYINMAKLVRFIANHTICIIRENSICVITINPKTKMPGSKTSLSAVVRYLDKGDLNTVSTSFVSRVFIEHRRNLQEFWKIFLESKGLAERLDTVT